MITLSLEHLKKMRERYLWNGVSEVTTVLDELIAIREQVPYGYAFEDRVGREQFQRTRPVLAQDHRVTIVELFTAPQKLIISMPPVERWRNLDEVRAQNAYRILVEKTIEAAGGKVAE